MKRIKIGPEQNFYNMTVENTGKKLICNYNNKTYSVKLSSSWRPAANLFCALIGVDLAKAFYHEERIAELEKALRPIL